MNISPLQFGINITLVGLVIVFTALCLIALFIKLISKLDKTFIKAEKKQKHEAINRGKNEPGIDDITLIIIAAAVCAILGKKSKIRKIKKIDNQKNTWATAGRLTLMASHSLKKNF